MNYLIIVIGIALMIIGIGLLASCGPPTPVRVGLLILAILSGIAIGCALGWWIIKP